MFRVSWFDAGDLRRGLLVLGLCLAGTLCAKFAMAPYGVAALAPLSLWPALFLTRRMSLTDSALAGVLSSFFLSYLAFYWFAGALGRFGGYSRLQVEAVFLNLKYVALFWRWSLARRRGLRKWLRPRWLYFAFTLVLVDLLSPALFAWFFGNLWGGSLWMIQWAEFVGVHGVTFLLGVCAWWSFRATGFGLRLFGAWRSARR